jgi:uncharacterized protein YecT (DUF1311 family)
MKFSCLLAFAMLVVASAVAQTPSHPPIVHSRDVTGECTKLLAALPQPPAETTGTFKTDCDSAAFYFGIGRPRDFVAARKCAYVERGHTSVVDANPFAGPGALSMLYANGEGTPRNIELARRFTCENGWAAPAELAIRLDELAKIETSAHPIHFDLCDTATSGLSEGWCASINSCLQEVRRLEALHTFTDTLSPDALPAFRKLQGAEDAFDELRSGNEVDLSGTGRAAFELEEQDKLRDQFLINLKRFSAPHVVSPVPLPSADRQLNAAYQRLQQSLPSREQQARDPDSMAGTINFDGVQKTQRAWLDLRSAWIAFAKVTHSTASPNQVAAILTMQRVHQQQSLLPQTNR